MPPGERDGSHWAGPDLGRELWEKWVRTESSSFRLFPKGTWADKLLERGAVRQGRLRVLASLCPGQQRGAAAAPGWRLPVSRSERPGLGLSPVWPPPVLGRAGAGPEVPRQQGGSHWPLLRFQLQHGAVLRPGAGVGSPGGVAEGHPAKDELLARCNLQEATLDGLVTSCPCKARVHL